MASDGRALAVTRPDPYGWTVPEHGAALTVRYRVFGDRVDGTYLAIDTRHAHINMPSAIMWARGMDDRPVDADVRAAVGARAGRWRRSFMPVPTPLEFTAPNLQYLMDSPAEFGPVSIRQFEIEGQTFRFAAHHTGTAAELDGFVKDVEKIVRVEGAVFGEFPAYEPGTYTFLADYLPYASGDGMEHRNSTVMTSSGSIRDRRGDLLDTVAHEFFHCWNVERIRPRSLEPFDLERVEHVWRAVAGRRFHPVLRSVALSRAGLEDLGSTAATLARIDPDGHDQSRARRSIGRRNEPDGRIYRRRAHQRSDELVEHLDFLLSVWRRDCARARSVAARRGRTAASRSTISCARCGVSTANRVARVKDTSTVLTPSTMPSGVWRRSVATPRFAHEFFAQYIHGREVPDFAKLLQPAGFTIRARELWTGVVGRCSHRDEKRRENRFLAAREHAGLQSRPRRRR